MINATWVRVSSRTSKIVHRRQRQQAWNGSVVFVHAAIRKNQQRVPSLYRQRSTLAQLVQSALQARFAVADAEQRGQSGRQQITIRNPAQFFQFAIGEQRMRQLQHVAVLGRLFENVALAADVADQRHHHLFANGIDGRIRHLREELLEVVEQRLRLVREARQRRVGAHRTDRLFALGRHGRENHPQIFIAVAEGALARSRVLRHPDSACARAPAVDRCVIWFSVTHCAYGCRDAELLLDFFVGDDAAFHRIHQEHLAGLQAALSLHLLWRNVEHAGFRRHDRPDRHA